MGYSPPRAIYVAFALILGGIPLAALGQETFHDLGAEAVRGAVAKATGRDADVAVPGHRKLNLDVVLGGVPLNTLALFDVAPGGGVSTSRRVLRELGLLAPGSGPDDQDIPLSALPGARYTVDEPGQRIILYVPDASRDRRVLRVNAQPPLPAATSDWGAFVNHDTYTASTKDFAFRRFAYGGVSSTLEGVLSSPYGSLQATGVARETNPQTRSIRLDTRFASANQEHEIGYAAGDSISGSLPWTRSLRYGGVQVQRDFGTRPDLYYQATPSYSGSAGVPSNVDVFVNGVKTFSQPVQGPFEVRDIPVLGGGGNAQVVVTDENGKQSTQTVSLFSSPRLLGRGTYDFSFDAGTPRLLYGVLSDRYDPRPFGSGVVRYGVTDWFTAEGNAEGTRGLADASLGGALRAASLGTFEGSVSGSKGNVLSRSVGTQGYVGFQTFYGLDWSLNLGAKRSFGQFNDVVGVANLDALRLAGSSNVTVLSTLTPFAAQQSYAFSVLPPKQSIFLGGSHRLSSALGTIGAAYVDELNWNGTKSRIASASYTNTVFGWSLAMTSFADVADRKNFGILGALTIPLAKDRVAAAAVGYGNSGPVVQSSLTQQLGQAPGDVGWTLRDVEDTHGTGARGGSGAYRSDYGATEVGVLQSGSSVQGTAEHRGSVTITKAGINAGQVIDDSVAVVQAGTPNVAVSANNTVVAKTGGNGVVAVPVYGYQRNAVAIDARKLPVDAVADATEKEVVPKRKAVVFVPFGVKSMSNSAIVKLTTPDGKAIQGGRAGTVNGTDFVVGYEGEVYARGLVDGTNDIEVEFDGGTKCVAQVFFARRPGRIVRLPPVKCVPKAS